MKNVERVEEIIEAGWNIVPLPYGLKGKPPIGYTGGSKVRREPFTTEQFISYCTGEGWDEFNVGLVMSEDMIAIDVDGVQGVATLKALEEKLGVLPKNVFLTSRDSLDDGFTIFFRVDTAYIPEGMGWASTAGRSIDIRHAGLSYCVTEPSYNANRGNEYRWVRKDRGDEIPLGYTPDADSFPELPFNYYLFLLKPKNEQKDVVDHSVLLPSQLSGAICSHMREVINDRIRALKFGGSRHDSAMRAVFAIYAQAAKGHRGADEALKMFYAKWANCFSDGERDIAKEFSSLKIGAITKIKRMGLEYHPCACGLRGKRYSSVTTRSTMPSKLLAFQ